MSRSRACRLRRHREHLLPSESISRGWASDAASQRDHWTRTQERQLLISNADEAQAMADYTLARYKDPADRISKIGVPGALRPSTVWPAVLGLDIGQRVNIKRRPLGSSGYCIPQDEFIEGFNISAKPGKFDFSMNLWSSDVTPFWVLGDSIYGVLGQTTRFRLSAVLSVPVSAGPGETVSTRQRA